MTIKEIVEAYVAEVKKCVQKPDAFMMFMADSFSNLMKALSEHGHITLALTPRMNWKADELNAWFKSANPIYRNSWYVAPGANQAVTIADVIIVKPQYHLFSELVLRNDAEMLGSLMNPEIKDATTAVTIQTLAEVWARLNLPETSGPDKDKVLRHFNASFKNYIISDCTGYDRNATNRSRYPAVLPITSLNLLAHKLRTTYLASFDYLSRRRPVIMHAAGATVYLVNPDVPFHQDIESILLSKMSDLPYQADYYATLRYMYKPLAAYAVPAGCHAETVVPWGYHEFKLPSDAGKPVPEEMDDL